MKPAFIGIGAQKCASTWLYDILSDHPEVRLSEKKELDFFSSFFDRGYQWYESHFGAVEPGQITGEISPSYFHTPGVPERIRAYNPDVRLIVLLREPYKRALSNHRHEVRIGHLRGEDLSFERGMRNNPLYVEQGLYATHLERWLAVFPREQLLVLLFDEVKADARKVATRVYEFLGIDAAHDPAALRERSNESYVNRSAAVESAKDSIRGVLRTVGLGWLWEGIGRTGLRNLYRSANRQSADAVIPPPRPETEAALRERFDAEIARLEHLTGFDLSGWRRTVEGGDV